MSEQRVAVWIVGAVALVLSACGGGGGEDNNDGQSNDPAAEDMRPAPSPDMRPAPSPDMCCAPQPDMPAQGDMSPAVADMGPGDSDMADMDEGMGSVVPAGCNPLAYEIDCLYPYPSNVFLIEDEQTPSGHRVQLGQAAKLSERTGDIFDYMDLHPADGFSHHQPIGVYFGEPVDTSNVTFHDEDLAATMEPTSTTLLIRADTGEPVMHWAENDLAGEEDDPRVFFLRALENLEHETRYIVALQGLMGEDGEPIEAPEGFRQLRDQSAGDDPVLGPLSERYEQDVFPVLDALGVERASLVMAWDFTIQSEEMVTRDMLTMRADLMARLEQSPPAITVDEVIMDHNDQIAVRLEGTLEVPLYLEEPEGFSAIHRGEDGLPEQNGTMDVEFTLQIPYSAIPGQAGFEPSRMMQYGHGFFGSREEINYGFMRSFSDEQSYITASVDWMGMSEVELTGLIGELLSNPSGALLFLDGTHQGVMNFIALTHALKTSFTELDELKRFGELLYDPDQIYYYGISQGHILGTTFVALSPHIDRAVMNVGGAPFSFMMSRSSNFREFLALIERVLGSYLEVQKFVTLCQHSFDRIDPSTYASRLVVPDLDGAPSERKILLQFGLWDHSVPTLAGMILARNSRTPVLTPSPIIPPGLEGVEGPVDGAAAVFVDYMVPDPPGIQARLPTEDQVVEVVHGSNVHEGVRRNPKIKEQIDTFLRPGGTITHPCEGPCDPE